MLDAFKTLTSNQFEAVFCTMNACLERCPDSQWNAPVVKLTFSQVVFHALFFADYYLGENEGALRKQAFHHDNEAYFRNYEELEDRPQELSYDKPTTHRYLEHCRQKAATVIAAETLESLAADCQFARRDFSRAELYVVNIRHIHHHAAQLSLRLRIDHNVEIPWVGSGWREF